MIGKTSAAALGVLLAGCAMAHAETLVEQSAEARMQLDFHVPDAALKAMLPAGTEPAVATPHGFACLTMAHDASSPRSWTSRHAASAS